MRSKCNGAKATGTGKAGGISLKRGVVLGGVRVAQPHSSFRKVGTGVEIRRILNALGVGHTLAGSK